MDRSEPSTRRPFRRLLLSSLLVVLGALVSGCGGPPSTPLPEVVTADFFPLRTGSWWEYDTFLPGFTDRPERFRFVVQAPDGDGGFPVVSRAVTAGSGLPRETYRLTVADGALRMSKGPDETITLLRFGARVGDTWACYAKQPRFRARLAEIRWERVMGAWRPIADVTFHAGSPETTVTKRYWFAPDLGWVRIVQRRAGGSTVEAILVDATIRPGAPVEP